MHKVPRSQSFGRLFDFVEDRLLAQCVAIHADDYTVFNIQGKPII